MTEESSAEQPRNLEPAQPIPADITNRGSERWDLGRIFKMGGLIFCASFIIFEGLTIPTFLPSFNINEFMKITSAALEVSAFFGITGGLVLGRSR